MVLKGCVVCLLPRIEVDVVQWHVAFERASGDGEGGESNSRHFIVLFLFDSYVKWGEKWGEILVCRTCLKLKPRFPSFSANNGTQIKNQTLALMEHSV